MEQNLKFITVKHGEDPESIIVFSPWLPHSDIKIDGEITAAGFVDLKEKTCHGRSKNLNIESNDRATMLLRAFVLK